MSSAVLRFERVFDLPREIVWDALVDSDLVSGWLAEAEIEPRIGGRFDLDWSHLESGFLTQGEILDLEEPHLLAFDTSNFGRTSLVLDDLEGGSRGRSTRLVVDVQMLVDQHFSGRITATWQLALEHLSGLLHGHPVDWTTWREVHGEQWDELVSEATRRK